jgi:glycyl-tRNA synthetase
MCEAYSEEVVNENDTRIVMHLHPSIAPYKACICPLSKQLSDKAVEVYSMLAKDFMVEYDDAGSIGKRYRRQDAIGTPMCITIDFDTENDSSVTIRDRDTMEQVRVKIEDLKAYIEEKVKM